MIHYLLIVWGLEWIVTALIEYFGQWFDLFWLEPFVLGTAIVLTVILAAIGWKNKSGIWQRSELLPVLMAIAGAYLLEWIGAVDPFFISIFRSIILSVLLVAAGMAGQRQLVSLGLWLFALTAVISIWFLGFSPMILGAAGGLCLVISAWRLKNNLR